MDFIRYEKRFDHIILVHDGSYLENQDHLFDWLLRYRTLVHSKTIFVGVDLNGKMTPRQDVENDVRNIFVSGFSESIFQALSKSSDGQLSRIVDDIDKKYQLETSVPKIETALFVNPAADFSAKTWPRIKVFFSSTFVDMHGERNLINYYLFPELAKRAKNLGIQVIPVDLRWGLAEGVAAEKQVETCLQQIDKCDIFVGILGQRYGWKPPIENSLKIKNMLMKRGCSRALEHLGQMSITELEMEYAALWENGNCKSFFFIRDHSAQDMELAGFETDDPGDQAKLADLKQRILRSKSEVMVNYPAKFRLSENIAMAHGLEDFGSRLFDVLWNAIISQTSALPPPTEAAPASAAATKGLTVETELQKQCNFCKNVANFFVGRSKHLDTILQTLKRSNDAAAGGIIEVSAKQAGLGRTAFMAKLAYQLMKMSKTQKTFILPYFAQLKGGPQAVGAKKQEALLNYIKTTLTNQFQGIVAALEQQICAKSRYFFVTVF